MPKIQEVQAREILDSRGNPTVEVDIRLEDGSFGRAAVPSGASTGQFEALELRDQGSRFRGKSVFKAVSNIHRIIAPALKGADAADQEGIDRRMIELDGTENKSRLGANAVLGVSMAVARAAAAARGQTLFDYLGKGQGCLLPLPEIQIIGGGAHANWRIDVQDFLLIAVGAKQYAETLEMTFDVYHAAGDILKERNRFFGVLYGLTQASDLGTLFFGNYECCGPIGTTVHFQTRGKSFQGSSQRRRRTM